MPTFTVFHEAKRYVGEGSIILSSHTFKAMLSNTAPVVATHILKADITEITAGSGYTAGGATLTQSFAETGAGTGIWKLSFTDFQFDANGGNIGPFQYVYIYDDTSASPLKPLLGYLDYGTALTVTDGNSLLMDIGSDGVLWLS